MNKMTALGVALVMAGFVVGLVRHEVSGIMILIGFIFVSVEMDRHGF